MSEDFSELVDEAQASADYEDLKGTLKKLRCAIGEMPDEAVVKASDVLILLDEINCAFIELDDAADAVETLEAIADLIHAKRHQIEPLVRELTAVGLKL